MTVRNRLAALALIAALLVPGSAFAAGLSEISCAGVATLVETVQSDRGEADPGCTYDYPTP